MLPVPVAAEEGVVIMLGVGVADTVLEEYGRSDRDAMARVVGLSSTRISSYNLRLVPFHAFGRTPVERNTGC